MIFFSVYGLMVANLFMDLCEASTRHSSATQDYCVLKCGCFLYIFYHEKNDLVSPKSVLKNVGIVFCWNGSKCFKLRHGQLQPQQLVWQIYKPLKIDYTNSLSYYVLCL